MQRVFKLAPTFEATDTLLADDLHSAQKIYRMGETEFVRRYADRPGFTRKPRACLEPSRRHPCRRVDDCRRPEGA